MALVHILDKQTDEIIGTLNCELKELSAATWMDSTKNENYFDFTALKKFDLLQKRNRLLLQDTDGFFHEFIIIYAEQNKRTQKVVKSNASFVDLVKAKVIEPQTLQGATAETATSFALIGTEWQPGEIEYNGVLSITIDKYTNPLDLLNTIAFTFGLIINYRIEIKGNKINGRFVDMKQEIAGFEGKEITFGKDLTSILRKEDSSNIVTALFGVGPQREDGTRLTVLVEDQDALQRWGRGGQHLIEVYTPQSTEQDMTIDDLRTLTENELQKRIDAVVTYECTAASLEHIFGRSHEKIRKGQTMRIKDDGYDPPLYVEARIDDVETDPISKKILSFKIGTFTEYSKADLEAQISFLQKQMSDKTSKLILSTISASAGTIFKNGLGATTLTVRIFQGAEEVDLDGSKFTYSWSKYDKNGTLVSTLSGKTIDVLSIDVDEKAIYEVVIKLDKNVSTSQITLTNVNDGQDATKVDVISTNGVIFKEGTISTVLEARVYSGSTDITDKLDSSRFRWTRVSDDSEGDAAWNNEYFGGTKTVTITTDDVANRATFFCEILDQ